eukprot:CAMPEP_0184390832 /NCGR_PEP_ID=MMETSP0007-20130409/13614_1 /TAXON_ID=97485 /ORGANISM="Prymnesium parvum, Strain Texoma1" /LENGTH=96 /DNA_ID=CAMNT_0026740713 /DNA_START=161 /DNA_END=452 /DNA_ORIENTATION=-
MTAAAMQAAALPLAAPPINGAPLVLQPPLNQQHTLARRDAAHHALLNLLAKAGVPLQQRARLGERPLHSLLVLLARPPAVIRVDPERRLSPPRGLE